MTPLTESDPILSQTSGFLFKSTCSNCYVYVASVPHVSITLFMTGGVVFGYCLVSSLQSPCPYLTMSQGLFHLLWGELGLDSI